MCLDYNYITVLLSMVENICTSSNKYMRIAHKHKVQKSFKTTHPLIMYWAVKLWVPVPKTNKCQIWLCSASLYPILYKDFSNKATFWILDFCVGLVPCPSTGNIWRFGQKFQEIKCPQWAGTPQLQRG